MFIFSLSLLLNVAQSRVYTLWNAVRRAMKYYSPFCTYINDKTLPDADKDATPLPYWWAEKKNLDFTFTAVCAHLWLTKAAVCAHNLPNLNVTSGRPPDGHKRYAVRGREADMQNRKKKKKKKKRVHVLPAACKYFGHLIFSLGENAFWTRMMAGVSSVQNVWHGDGEKVL